MARSEQSHSLEEIAKKAGFNLTKGEKFSPNSKAFFRYGILPGDGSSPNFYIRFSTLLEFLEKTQQFYSENGVPIIKYDYEVGKSFMNTNRWIISPNPRVCIVNPGPINLPLEWRRIFNKEQNEELQYFITKLNNFLDEGDTGNLIYNFFKKGPTKKDFDPFEGSEIPIFKKEVGGVIVGDIMNIYLNVDFVFDTLLQNLDSEKESISIFKFLNTICKALDNNLGGLSSLAPFINESTNTLSIIEEGDLPNKNKILENLGLDNKNIPLQLYGYKSEDAGFVKSFNLKTEITNDLAVMTSIGAQASSEHIKGIDATAFNLWNRGLIDRFFKVKKESLVENKENEEDPRNKLGTEYAFQIISYIKLLADYEEEGGFNVDDIELYKNALKGVTEYQKELTKLDNPDKVSQPGFLPINLNLTLDGMSGPTILQQFETDGRFLPTPINDTLTFLIKGLNHKISNNIWTTSIDSLSVPKNIEVDSTNAVSTTNPSFIEEKRDVYQDFIQKTPWSACYISYVMYEYISKSTSEQIKAFPYSAAHTKYAQDIRNGNFPFFKALNPSTTKIEVGDIIIFNRSNSGLTWKTKNWRGKSSHGDIVYKIDGERMSYIGGNKGNPGCVKKSFMTLVDGKIPSGKIGTGDYQVFTIIRAQSITAKSIGRYAEEEFIKITKVKGSGIRNNTIHDNDPVLYPFLDQYYKQGNLAPPPLPEA